MLSSREEAMPFLVFAAIAVSIAYLGDAYGHLHQAAIHDNHAPDKPASPSGI